MSRSFSLTIQAICPSIQIEQRPFLVRVCRAPGEGPRTSNCTAIAPNLVDIFRRLSVDSGPSVPFLTFRLWCRTRTSPTVTPLSRILAKGNPSHPSPSRQVCNLQSPPRQSTGHGIPSVPLSSKRNATPFGQLSLRVAPRRVRPIQFQAACAALISPLPAFCALPPGCARELLLRAQTTSVLALRPTRKGCIRRISDPTRRGNGRGKEGGISKDSVLSARRGIRGFGAPHDSTKLASFPAIHGELVHDDRSMSPTTG